MHVQASTFCPDCAWPRYLNRTEPQHKADRQQQRDLDVEDAMAILDQALAYKDRIVAVGLASAEVGNPPAKFTEAFARRDRRAF